MKTNKITLFKYTFPLIISGLTEQMLLFTDVLLISFKGEVFLASIGLIDAFFLCGLSYGFALNDTFQNYYSRNKHDSSLITAMYRKSLNVFFKYSIIVGIIFSGIAYVLSSIIENNIYQLFLSNIPIIIPLLILTYISMSMNSFLLGMGKTKIIGIISLISLIMNGILGYFFLFLFHFNISPLALILYASIIAELIGIFMMFYTIRNLNVKIEQNIPIKKIIITTITKSSYYPALSNLSFHIGSFLLFLFCSTYFSLNETAILTLMLSYWGLLLVPAEAFSETSLNLFSLLISRKQNCFFLQLRSNIILTSLYVSVILFTAILFMDIIIYDTTLYKITLIFNIILLVIVGTFNEIFSISLIVKFKNRLFALSKIIYGSIAIIFTVVLTLILENRAIAILLSLLIAQLCTFFFLRRKSTQLWTK